jgi:hypothetical protein
VASWLPPTARMEHRRYTAVVKQCAQLQHCTARSMLQPHGSASLTRQCSQLYTALAVQFTTKKQAANKHQLSSVAHDTAAARHKPACSSK